MNFALQLRQRQLLNCFFRQFRLSQPRMPVVEKWESIIHERSLGSFHVIIGIIGERLKDIILIQIYMKITNTNNLVKNNYGKIKALKFAFMNWITVTINHETQCLLIFLHYLSSTTVNFKPSSKIYFRQSN